MNRPVTAALAAMLALGVSSAFAQVASGTMSETEMASGTMAKHPTAKSKMTRSHAKKSNSMDMKHEASGAMSQ
jgi:hypothetical protein